MIQTRYLVTVKTEHIEAIISKAEVLGLFERNEILNLDTHALISIGDPEFTPDEEEERSVIETSICEQFGAYIQAPFWDQTTEENGKQPISKELVDKLVNFISSNKDKTFIIHCSAGISRSAGVGLLVEYVCGGYTSVYDFKTNFNDVITKHYRYAPNLSVIDWMK